MGTQQTEVGNDQEVPPQAPRSLHTHATVREEKGSPVQTFPQPPGRPPRPKSNRWFVIGTVLVLLALILSLGGILIAGLVQRPGGQVTPTPLPKVTVTAPPSGSDTTPTPEPGVVPGPQNGPAGVNDPAYWDRLLGTQGTNGKVERVSFANVLGNPSLQALVTVRHSDANRTLNVYVFDKITSAKPPQLFKLQGLVKGDAKISYYNSILTAEVDQHSTLNAGKTSGQWTQDLFREFAWNEGEGTLVQVASPASSLT